MKRATIAAALIVLAGCGGNGEPSVEQVVSDPETHYGESLTFESRVSNTIDHRVWEMAGGRLFLISDESVKPPPENGEVLRVTGTVRQFDKQTIEGDLGINIEDHFFHEPFLADDVAIVVDTVERP
jgi:hypothetical protein